MTRPATLVSHYPPLNFSLSIPIGPGVNWATVTPPGRTAAEVIFFNFGTSVAREINWYLWHYLGRTKLAPDGVNLTFGTDPANPSIAANPFEKFTAGDTATIYVPPAAWKIPTFNDEALREDVLSTLQSTALGGNFFNFTVNSIRYSLRAGAFASVREHVRLRKIFIRHDPSSPSDGGYIHGNSDPNANTLRMIISRANTPLTRALVVHEATHAAFDIASIRMPSRVSESMAYVAQTHFLSRIGGNPLAVTSDLALFTAAAQVAGRVRDGVREFTEVDLLPLVTEVARKYPKAVYAYDGV